jgi:hypothetical protein
MYNYLPHILGMLFIIYVLGFIICYIISLNRKRKIIKDSIKIRRQVIFHRKINIIVIETHPQRQI